MELKNKLEEVFDPLVIDQVSWVMYGSTSKSKQKPYKLTHIINTKLEDQSPDSTWDAENLVEIMSVRRDQEQLSIKEDTFCSSPGGQTIHV